MAWIHQGLRGMTQQEQFLLYEYLHSMLSKKSILTLSDEALCMQQWEDEQRRLRARQGAFSGERVMALQKQPLGNGLIGAGEESGKAAKRKKKKKGKTNLLAVWGS